ncbi:sialidase [Renibacterium salmoninarum ATCC 33209]|uniref:endo-alpha-N-acetylgalactosaminidase family protein n=1 Tax=Renibacterium salmoninarum TaxID=1646 RepID=UPI000162BCBB|nr:endo-alpha-N-acetylgalactosaminidase family protein [Renibacterium salmoninarum]ABY23065.1 sialidase [Renibacterium salmoninarum ATCC 33209]
MAVSSGAWLYRSAGSDQTEELPWSKVVISGDANADGKVDWQDGAIAYRSIESKPAGGDDVKNRVVTHIPFNFASQATHPFLRTLDDVKHIALATDGLGQMALEKGYTSEGHDSANSDFGGNFNERAGGLTDFNAMLSGGSAYGATFGVHINNTEAYPEANSFSNDFVDPTKKGWNWLDQSFYIDQQRDILSGSQQQRIDQLRSEAGPNLTMAYVDVYYESGWKSYRLQKGLKDAGFSVASEFATAMPANNTWSHWANDEKHGGSNNIKAGTQRFCAL